MSLTYAILMLLGLAIVLQALLWNAQRKALRLVREQGERLALLERRLAAPAAVVSLPAARQAAPADAGEAPDPLQQAIVLARAGRTAAEIAASCSISEAEAELLVRMRGAPM